jgi:hypothetical protein
MFLICCILQVVESPDVLNLTCGIEPLPQCAQSSSVKMLGDVALNREGRVQRVQLARHLVIICLVAAQTLCVGFLASFNGRLPHFGCPYRVLREVSDCVGRFRLVRQGI